jgi:ribonuclease E
MLDTEPNDTTTDQTTTDAPSGEAGPVKAARKAPAKRAPRKAAKKAADPAPETAGPDRTGPQSEVGAADEREPATKAPRKRAAKKAGTAAGTPAAEASAPDAAAQPASGQSEDDSASEAAAVPAKRAPRKRASKKVAEPAGAAPEPQGEAATEPPAGQPAAAAAPALAAPPVLFQPPAVDAPTRRRRTAKPVLAEPPVERGAELAFDDDAADDVDGLPDGEDAESTEAGEAADGPRKRRRRGRRGRGRSAEGAAEHGDADPSGPGAEPEDGEVDEVDEASELEDVEHADEVAEAALSASARRRRRRRRSSGDGDGLGDDDPPNTVTHVRATRSKAADDDGVRGVKGSTRLEAKRQRRRDNRDSGRRRAPILTEAEFLARREAVERVMAVRQNGDRTQIAVLEDDVLVEHYVTRASAASAVGNVYLGKVQNVLPSMEAAFIDIGRGRNGVLYAGEVNWDSAGLEGKARSIENALNPGDTVLVQVTKDPIGHKGARLTSQVSLPGRFVVYVPGGGMTGISRKLPDTERSRLKAILKKVVPDEAGVIVRTAAEGASEQDLVSDVERLKAEWESISAKAGRKSDGPMLVHGEPDLAIRVVRDIFNDDFSKLIVSGSDMHATLSEYVRDIAPDLADRISLHVAQSDLFRDLRVDEQLAKALDRKVWLPSGGSLVIDRTEAMTVVDVNTGKYTGSGGNLEQTVTRNNLEAAEEIVRQLRLRDLGGIVVIDFIDMVLESNRDLVLRRLTECLGRDRTKHQVAEVTSLGLVQMTRKRVGEGLLEAFSEPCEHCHGRGLIVHMEPVDKKPNGTGQHSGSEDERPTRGRRSRGTKAAAKTVGAASPAQPTPEEIAAENEKRRAAASAIAAIAAATAHHEDSAHGAHPDEADQAGTVRSDPGLNGVGAHDSHRGDTLAGQPIPTAQLATPERADAAPVPAVAATRPRRRRAASRPAGPPVSSDSAAGASGTES